VLLSIYSLKILNSEISKIAGNVNKYLSGDLRLILKIILIRRDFVIVIIIVIKFISGSSAHIAVYT